MEILPCNYGSYIKSPFRGNYVKTFRLLLKRRLQVFLICYSMSRSLLSSSSNSYRYLLSGGTAPTSNCDILTPLLTSSVYSTILTLNTHFVDGDFVYLDANLTLDDYESLSSQLYALKNPSSQMYESVRGLLSALLQNLYQGVLQHHILIATEANLAAQTEKANNLNSVESILAYLDYLQNQSIIFRTNITTVSAQIKPEYSIYISLYGMPLANVFDPDKLAAIVANM